MNEKVIQIDYKNKKIYLIPTAHVSVESAKMVEETIDEINAKLEHGGKIGLAGKMLNK